MQKLFFEQRNRSHLGPDGKSTLKDLNGIFGHYTVSNFVTVTATITVPEFSPHDTAIKLNLKSTCTLHPQDE